MLSFRNDGENLITSMICVHWTVIVADSKTIGHMLGIKQYIYIVPYHGIEDFLFSVFEDINRSLHSPSFWFIIVSFRR